MENNGGSEDQGLQPEMRPQITGPGEEYCLFFEHPSLQPRISLIKPKEKGAFSEFLFSPVLLASLLIFLTNHFEKESLAVDIVICWA